MNRRTLAIIAGFIGFSALAWIGTRLAYPERTAYAGHCVGRIDGALANRCDVPVVAALCREADGTRRPDDDCAFQTLAPGEAFTATLDTALTGRPYTMACNAPFVPRWKVSNSNANLFQKGCRKPDKTSGQPA